MPHPSFDQHLAQQLGTVGHDPIHAEIAQAVHLVTIVDRPHVHRDTRPVRALDEAGGRDRELPVVHGHLGRIARWDAAAGQEQPCYRPRTEGRAQAITEPLAQAPQTPVAERTHTDPIDRRGVLDHLRDRLDGGIGLAVDVHPHVGPFAEDLGERGDRRHAADAQLAQLSEAHRLDARIVTGRTAEVRIVERDEDAVCGDLHIGLEVAVPEIDRVLERGHRVLGCFAGTASMGERDRALPVQEGVGRRRHLASIVGGVATDDIATEHPGAETITVRAPYDGRVLGEVASHTVADVDRAVATARAATPIAPWRRAEILDAAAAALAARTDEFARTIALEAAKPIRTARAEVTRAVGTFRFAAAEARTLAGEMVPLDALAAGEGKIGFTLRVPVGVVGAIAPFNFPLNLVVHKVAPAIAAGCPVVLKPASQTPMSSIALAALLLECGLPAEHLQVVTGPGGVVGAAIVDHPDVALVTFTGSAEVGWALRARAPRKRVGLELGNNSPLVIEPDGDWAAAAAKVAVAGFSHAGQSCISTQRIYLHEAIADSFTDALVARVGALVVGDPLDEATDVSALITAGERDRVVDWVDEARSGGARVLTGGWVDDHGILVPTVLDGVTPEMRVVHDEVFGPVVGLARYTDLDDALRAANDSRYGLQAAVYTSNLVTALRAVRELDYGGVLVNEVPTWRADQQPYGGVRASGNTREGPAWAVREMTEVRMVVIGDA